MTGNLPDAPLILGKHMARLTPKQRAFVFAYLNSNCSSKAEAVRAAGYECANDATVASLAYNLLHNPKIIDAIAEIAGNEIKSGALVGMKGIFDVAMDPTHKDRFRACKELLDRAGILMPEHRQTITVKDERDNKELIKYIREQAEKMGLDPKVLLGEAGVVVDADYEILDELDEFDVPPEEV